MDVIIPSHNLKILSSSITTLSKIGKILYMEFDPLDGLTIRSLNDAKSSFIHFHFEVGFFERCSTSSDVHVNSLGRNRNRERRKKDRKRKRGSRSKKKRSGSASSSTVRGRRLADIRNRRNRSSGSNSRRSLSRGRVGSRARRRQNRHDGDHALDEQQEYARDHRLKEGEEKEYLDNDVDDDVDERDNNGMENHDGNDHDSEGEELAEDEKFICKVPIKAIATILKPRKGVSSLRIRSTYSSPTNIRRTANNNYSNGKSNDRDHDDDDDDDDGSDNMSFDDTDDDDSSLEMGCQMQLSFEYSIQSNGIMRILHKVGVSNAEGIIAIAPKTHCSEIITVPKVLLTMLDQVKSTSEVLLTVNDAVKKVVASTFDIGDTVRNTHNDGTGENGNNVNALLSATAPSILKTETSIDCTEFEDFHFMDKGAIESVLEEEQNERNTVESSSLSNGGSGGGGGSATTASLSLPPPPPEHVHEEVKLVFSIKEARAMLQFCASSQAIYMDDEDARVIISFYWGGRPVIIETEGDAFHGELILATVDHHLLTGVGTRYTPTSSIS